MTRRGYLDWLRGIAVLVMIEAHTLDAWSLPAEHARPAYRIAALIGGFGAPLFLFLAGAALALAAGTRRRRGLRDGEVARRAFMRGAQVFGIAFLIRASAWLVSQGPFVATLLKVDVLHVMGLSMMGAAAVWALAARPRDRLAILLALAAVAALIAPLIRTAGWLETWPTHLAWYFRTEPGWTQFTLFPWSGFLFVGAAIGIWLDDAQRPDVERRVIVSLAAVGVAAAATGYALSLRPAIYADVSFWTTSPTFFLLRAGIITLLVAVAYAWNARRTEATWLHRFGIASLFVYWFHVELVYGVPTMWIHRRLTFEQALAGVVAVTVLMYGLVLLKESWQHARRAG